MKLIRRNRRCRQDRKGLAMTEFAFVLPVMVLIVLGVIEMARAFEVAQMLTAAAREGGRLGMLYGIAKEDESANQRVINDIYGYLAAQGIDEGVTVEILRIEKPDEFDFQDDLENLPDQNLEEANRETYFMVRVSVEYDDVAYHTPLFLGGTELAGDIVVRHE